MTAWLWRGLRPEGARRWLAWLSSASVNAFDETERDLPPQRVAELLDSGQVQVVDVREQYEYDAGHITGVLHIELEHLAGRAMEIDRDKPVVFQCRVGRRSALAAQAFQASGYDAYNMAGGITAWAQAGLPLEPEDGTVAPHGPGGQPPEG